MLVSVGHGGWLRVDAPDRAIPGPLYIRLQPDAEGRWRTIELYLDGQDRRITGRMLRELPLAEIEAMAGEPDIREQLRARAEFPGPPLSVLASYFATTFLRAQHWVADAFRSQIAGSGIKRVGRAKQRTARPADEPPPLRPPEDGRLTDEFLRHVAAAYHAAVRRGEWPGPALAEQAGVAKRTVQRWIYLARKRGVMDPGERGRVG